MNIRNKKILITGGGGFVGTHLVKNLTEKRKVNLKDLRIPRSKELDLRVYKNARNAVRGMDIVFHLATDVGGLGYSCLHPAQQYYNCSLLDLQVLRASMEEEIDKIVLVSSACAYGSDVPIPLSEKVIFNGIPAKTHDGYGMAKRMTVFLADFYRREYGLNAVVMVPNNMYGPGDLFDLQDGHVVPSLIRKCLTQNKLVVWGNGNQTRDFLYVEDGAEGIILAMEKLETSEPVNLGTGEETSIKRLVEIIVKRTGFNGPVSFDRSKPRGQIKRSVDISRAKKLLGYRPKWNLQRGVKETVAWYKKVRLGQLIGDEKTENK